MQFSFEYCIFTFWEIRQKHVLKWYNTLYSIFNMVGQTEYNMIISFFDDYD